MEKIRNFFSNLTRLRSVVMLSIFASTLATWYSYTHHIIVAYGDAESHLNIAKRVVDSISPGFAQLGGIWLPLPHILLLPFIKSDFLWRTGLAGSIVSGLAFVVSAIFIYKLTVLLTKSQGAGFVASLVFMLNPNVLYMQSTPMTELTLIAFFVLSSYYFIRFIQDQRRLNDLLLAALFGFCASLSRYDGWFLIGVEALVLAFLFLPIRRTGFTFSFDRKRFPKFEGYLILFGTLGFFGIVLWLAWGFLILGDPLYFTHSQFSAKSQQSSWLLKGELPAYKHLGVSTLYYFFTSMTNVGFVVFAAALLGFLIYVFYHPSKQKFLASLVLCASFLFYVVTLYIGQSVIFIRPLTPTTFDWTLFNVRYGVMMVPISAVFFAYLFARAKPILKPMLIGLLVIQTGLFALGYTPVVSKDDGTTGLSSYKEPDAQEWINQNYDGGFVLMDDYTRTISIVRSDIKMQDMIYIGNKPYWEQSLVTPERYARWIIIQKDDSVWRSLIDNPATEARLYTYFEKVYTSPNIVVFRRNNSTQTTMR